MSDTRLTLRTTTEKVTVWKLAADAEGMTLNAYIGFVMDRAAPESLEREEKRRKVLDGWVVPEEYEDED